MNVKINFSKAQLYSFFILFGATIEASADSFSFSGYVKSYALAQEEIEIQHSNENIDASFQSQNSVRLMGSYLSRDVGNFEFHYEVQPIYISNTDFISDSGDIGSTIAIGANPYRYKDLDAVMNTVGDNTVILQNLDRLNYQYNYKYGDLTVGRQVISFGSARFINPTDIFIPFAIQTLNQEYRIGVDAIRFTADVGDFALIDSGIIIGEDAHKENNAYFLRGKNSFDGNDVEAMFIHLDDAWLIGGGVERAIGNFGFWFETAFMQWDNVTYETDKGDQTKAQKDYWRTSIGTDYAITENIITMFEYHYNGAGSSKPNDYTELPNQPAYQKAGVFLLGQHYLIPSVSWIATPLLTVNSSAFYNIDDQSLFITLVGERSWSDNLYSDFGAYISFGDKLTYIENSDSIEAGSEFGSYPVSLYASIRYYF